MVETIDLRGLICPEPVLTAKRKLEESGLSSIHCLVDDQVCVNNLKRLSGTMGATASVSKKEGYFTVTIDRAGSKQGFKEKGQDSKDTTPDNKTGVVIFLAKDTFGQGDDPAFSRTLTNLFLQSVKQSGHRIRAVVMANSGVKLLGPDSPCLEVLNEFKHAGVEVLACGLCLEFYGLKEHVPCEQITNMYSIVEYLFAADRVLSP